MTSFMHFSHERHFTGSIEPNLLICVPYLPTFIEFAKFIGDI
jgi:hypothetical protein